MRLRVVLLGLTILLFVAVSFGSFKYGELQSRSANTERDLDEKLAAAFATQSIKLLLKADEEMSKGNLRESRESLVTHLGDSLYFVGKGLARNDKAYSDIAGSLCSRRQQISTVLTTLPEGKPTDDANVRVNRQSRRKLFVEGLAEIEKYCAAPGKQQ